jgi:hypothetical protein
MSAKTPTKGALVGSVFSLVLAGASLLFCSQELFNLTALQHFTNFVMNLIP